MNRFLFAFSIVLLTAASCNPDQEAGASAQKPATGGKDPETGLPVRGPNPWKNAGCELVTDEEVARLFDFDVREATLNSKALPDQSFCLRTWNKPDWKERENNNEKEGSTYMDPKNTLVLQVLDYGQPDVADAQMESIRRDRRDTFEEDISGIGDAAVWSTSTRTLLVQKGHLVINITLEYFDQPHDNLSKAKQVAALALKKM